MKREASTGKMRERVAKCSSRDSSSSVPLSLSLSFTQRVKRDVRDKPLQTVKIRQPKTRQERVVSYSEDLELHTDHLREVKREEIDVSLLHSLP